MTQSTGQGGTFGEQAVARMGEAPDPASFSGEIVVGIDGSEQSYGALSWAVGEAKRRNKPIRLVTAYALPVYTGTGFDAGYTMVDEKALAAGVAKILDEAARQVEDQDVELRATVETGDASTILQKLSERAQLVVVGSRSTRGFLGRLLGTVSTSLPAHSHCPVVVVPHAWAKAHQKDAADLVPSLGVAVGSDGSEQARKAILAAAEEAVALGVNLKLINAVAPYTGALTWVPSAVDFEAVYREIGELQEKIKRWVARYYPDLTIEAELIDGSPAQVLLDVGERSDLVVVGTRGRGGLAGMLLGSTSQGVLHSSQNPVMIVPELRDERVDEAPEAGITWG